MRLCLFFLITFAAGRSLATELDLPSDKIRSGETVYLEKCADCHGKDATGASGPDVQGILLSDVVVAAQGIESMPEIELEAGEADAIAVFLMSLAPDQAKRRLKLK